LKRLIAQRTLLSSRYTGNVEKCYNFMLTFSRKLKMELLHTRYFESVTVK